MKVLVIGSAGTLASAIRVGWVDDEVADVPDVDIADEAAVVAAVRDHGPDAVVSAAALDDPAACEGDPQRAWAVNTAGPWWVARASALVGATMVHLSTADVFDGVLGRPYTEFDRPAPTSLHGRTRDAGEQLVRQTLPEHCIVRHGWLVDDLVAGLGDDATPAPDLAPGEGDPPGGDRVVAVDDAETGSPTVAADLAAALRRLTVGGRHGTFHVVNAGAATRYEVAAAAMAARGRGPRLHPVAAGPAVYRALDGVAARLAGLAPPDDWRLRLDRVAGGRP